MGCEWVVTKIKIEPPVVASSFKHLSVCCEPALTKHYSRRALSPFVSCEFSVPQLS